MRVIEHAEALYLGGDEDFIDGKLERGVVEDKYSYVATFEEIKENDFNLNIPRYVDTFEEEEPVDMKAVKVEIAAIESELVEVQKDQTQMLKLLIRKLQKR